MPANSFIPRFEWLNVTVTGNRTSGSATISNIASTTNIQVGMTCEATGVPSGTTVLSKTSTTVTLSANATATATGASFEFYFYLEFDYPPMDDDGEQLDAKERRSVSISGLTQVSVDHTEYTRKQKYRFITPTLLTSLQNFFNTHGKLGESFRFYESKEVDSYVSYELAKYEFKPKRLLYKASVTGFLYDLEMSFRRVA